MPLPREILAEDLGRELEAWAEELQSLDLEPALRECVPILIDDFEDHFIQEMGDNGPWAPRKRAYRHPPLIKTGAMLEATRDTGNPDNIHSVYWAMDQTLMLGVRGAVVNYAGFHQYGTSKMPARPFVWASEEALALCQEAFGQSAFVLIVGTFG